MSNIDGVEGNFLTNIFCTAQKMTFGNENSFERHGGMEAIGVAMTEGMVMAISLWDDLYSDMTWLGGIYPPGTNDSLPGVGRGNCAASNIDYVEINQGSSAVVFRG